MRNKLHESKEAANNRQWIYNSDGVMHIVKAPSGRNKGGGYPVGNCDLLGRMSFTSCGTGGCCKSGFSHET